MFLVGNAQVGYYLDGPEGLRVKVDKSLEEIEQNLTLMYQGLITLEEKKQQLEQELEGLHWYSSPKRIIEIKVGMPLIISIIQALSDSQSSLESQRDLLVNFQKEIGNDEISQDTINVYLMRLYNNNITLQNDASLVYKATNELLTKMNAKDANKTNFLISNKNINLAKMIFLFNDDSRITREEKDLVQKSLNNDEKTMFSFLKNSDEQVQKLALLLITTEQSRRVLNERNKNIKARIEGSLLGVRLAPVPVSPPVVVSPVPVVAPPDPLAYQAPARDLFPKDTDIFKGSPSSWPLPYFSGWRTPSRGINNLVDIIKREQKLSFDLKNIFVVRQVVTHMEIEVCYKNKGGKNICRSIVMAIPPSSETNQDPFYIRVSKVLVDYFSSEKARKADRGMNVIKANNRMIDNGEVQKINDQDWMPSTPVPFWGPFDENAIKPAPTIPVMP